MKFPDSNEYKGKNRIADYSICVKKLIIKEKKPADFKSSKKVNNRRLQKQNISRPCEKLYHSIEVLLRAIEMFD